MDQPSSSGSSASVSQGDPTDGEDINSFDQLSCMQRLMKIELVMTREETIALRQQVVPNACSVHFEKSPLKLTLGQGQYLYDDSRIEYLDCVNCVAHVGHCHPVVVKAGRDAMRRTGPVSTYGMSEIGDQYIQKLRTTLPAEFDTFLFVSSGSEANDLAYQLARRYTGGTDVVVVDRSFHGCTTVPVGFSPKAHAYSSSSKIADFVHVVPCPDLYRGKYREYDPIAIEKYNEDARDVIRKAIGEKNRKLACLVVESIMCSAGIIIPDTEFMKSVYQEIRAAGGLVIADEAQTGLGRCGTTWWGFQLFDIVPDIITIGKPVGNGHPMAVVATKSSIAATFLPEQLEKFSCDNVTGAIGNAVINVLRKENLQLNARNVGSFLKEGLKSLIERHRNIGEVRGVGLIIGVDIVSSQEIRKPSQEIAEKICYMMKDHNIIIANDGIYKNVLILIPPMCFTCENAHRVILTLEKVLTKIEDEEDESNAENPMASTSQGYSSTSMMNYINTQQRAGPSTSASSNGMFGHYRGISLDEIDPEIVEQARARFDAMD